MLGFKIFDNNKGRIKFLFSRKDFGLAKIAKYHPEVIEDLQDILSEMYRELDAKPTVMDAIVNLNLRVHFDELRQLQDGFNQTFIQRSNAKNEGSKVVTQDVRLEAEVVITKLLKEIDLMQMKHSELDYNPLINNLNDTFTLFMSRAKTRTTIKKQFVAKSKVSPINTTTTAQNGNSGAVAVE